MKVYVSYKSYLWNFKGYEAPICERLSNKVIEFPIEKLTEKSMKDIEEVITEEEDTKYKEKTPYGWTEVVILGITKLDEEEE